VDVLDLARHQRQYTYIGRDNPQLIACIKEQKTGSAEQQSPLPVNKKTDYRKL